MALRVFIVEDEMTIAFLLEDMLADMGHTVVATAMRLPQAEAMARTVDADLAILDINLDGRRSFPVAAILRERGVRLLFASGYGKSGLEPPFERDRVVAKPFETRDISSAIRELGL
jgi:DNA-binding response OmpR family regulator